MKKFYLTGSLASAMLLFMLYAYGQEVIHSIPAPGSKCQDVTWDGSHIWATDNTTRTYYKLDPEDGTVLYSIPFPPLVPYSEGITFDGQHLWTCGWEESNGYGSHLFKINPETGEVMETFDYPGGIYDNWPHGLTFDGAYLWATNFNTLTLDRIDPATGELMNTLPVPGEGPIGVAWDGSYLWTNDFQQGKIYKQDAWTGEVLGSIYMPGVSLRGMEWAGSSLWSVSWHTQTIYELNVGPLNIPEQVNLHFSIFPNPGQGIFQLRMNSSPATSVKIQVTDCNGRIWKEVEVEPRSSYSSDIQLDLTACPDGIYLVRATMEGKVWCEKLILKK